MRRAGFRNASLVESEAVVVLVLLAVAAAVLLAVGLDLTHA